MNKKKVYIGEKREQRNKLCFLCPKPLAVTAFYPVSLLCETGREIRRSKVKKWLNSR